MGEIFISVVIPCYDEMENLKKGVLDSLIGFFSRKNYEYEIIVVDDGSKDGSDTFIKDFIKNNSRVSLIQNQHLGKAGAVTSGMLNSKGEHILFTDMDQATPIEEVDKLIPFFQEGYDIVIGSRNTERKGSPLSRLIISRAAIILRKVIVGLPRISDTQCGFKMFRHDAAQRIFSKMHDIHHGFHKINASSVTAGFDVELLWLAEKMGYKIKEVQVKWSYVETRRVNPLRDSVEGLRELFIIRKNELIGKYKV